MPATYLSPGVYVEEVPSGSAPIAGVGTSTAGFIGIIQIGKEQSKATDPPPTTKPRTVEVSVDLTNEDGAEKKEFELPSPDGLKDGETLKITEEKAGTFQVNGNPRTSFTLSVNDDQTPIVTFGTDIPDKGKITGSYSIQIIPPVAPDATNDSDEEPTQHYWFSPISLGRVGTADGTKTEFPLNRFLDDNGRVTVKVDGIESQSVTLKSDKEAKLSTLEFSTAPKAGAITADYEARSVKAGDVKLCTNFSEFKQFFGDFSNVSGQNNLNFAHAVYGFFRNGGTRCHVVWIATAGDISSALEQFETIDEIAIVAAPGETSKEALTSIKDHCEQMGDRFAIFDSPETVDMSDTTALAGIKPFNSNYAAVYFPWLQVYDPATKAAKAVPPSGHMAGIYARVDNQRGVHKAPANETVSGAVGLAYKISKAKQDGLNPDGINCIRDLNGNIRVWGARTLGGNANGEFKYISTRRLFNYLSESIDEGTQWSVFEPNSPELWAKIRRSVTSFLTTVWRSGALFGSAPEQAFYVKCDEETNPPDIREQGQVRIEIGVAIVKPAEFVVFQLSQWVEGEA